MKKIITIVLMIAAVTVHAQNWKEFTEQKKTQLKYLADQIVALQGYAQFAEKGYAIVKTGLDAIQNINKGDLSMHQTYFNSLKKVNPKIKSYWQVADIIALQIKIAQTCHQQIKMLHNSNQFTADEIIYCGKVFTNLLSGCVSVIDQLTTLVTDGKIVMKDDERLKRINELHADIKDKYEFVQHFGSETNILSMQRYMDENDVGTARMLFGLQ